ncbi:hypothetical protein SKAU_G00146470 [Synaphobranchus kaupii]|uniref:Arf-GAP domain-containing protein n=1 Tax=Synaphobranchus kaupii TaxID=118154 RepID=A0A9Q1FT73_SYNKA|nr:hypothetical protein SKAU_G00146470 [Synaphobranchus kaupii]
MDADEVLENAKALAKQMSEYQGDLPPDAPASRDIPEAGRAELLDECEEQFSLLQQLQNEITLAETESLQNPGDQTASRVNALAAELKEWQELQPKLLSSNPEVLLAVGKEELPRLNKQLEMVLSCSQAKRDKLKDILKSEQEWLEEKKEVLRAATERVTAMQDESDRLSEKGVLQDMKKKIQRVKDYHDDLLETLGDILAEHFPLPQQEGNANKKRKNILPEPRESLISLHEMLEILMNKLVETPHEPYIQINETFWPPYTEMLLRGETVPVPEVSYTDREMTTRSEREKAQKLNEQHQAILSKMLREEDNKYCADCEAKGPRWASWNLGVFICIRCAGIHRNLGVHISRVKSVNLDQWTPAQIQSVQDMGNTRARQTYEANLPDNFRRPQTDQTVEFFIRDKYERKKYQDKNATSKSSDAAVASVPSPLFASGRENQAGEGEWEEGG